MRAFFFFAARVRQGRCLRRSENWCARARARGVAYSSLIPHAGISVSAVLVRESGNRGKRARLSSRDSENRFRRVSEQVISLRALFLSLHLALFLRMERKIKRKEVEDKKRMMRIEIERRKRKRRRRRGRKFGDILERFSYRLSHSAHARTARIGAT